MRTNNNFKTIFCVFALVMKWLHDFCVKELNKFLIATKMKILTNLIAIVLILSGCGKVKELEANQEKLQTQYDSLLIVSENNYRAVLMMDQIGVYLDSIDANRKWINVDLETGITRDDYESRLSLINDYVQKAEKKIAELEKSRSGFSNQVKRLKADLEQKNKEIEMLKAAVANLSDENLQLSSKLRYTEEDLEKTQLALEARRQELSLLEARLAGLIKATKVSEAESYYSRGESMELVAARTQLSPKKKQDAYRQALEFYEKSVELGYEPAKEKVALLKTKVKS
jgi:chromosome segregation ATPase